MVELGTRHPTGQPVRIKSIADAHGISQRFLVQILLQLKGVGLVASSRGSAGGYQLARRPESISIAEIIRAIDRSPQANSALHTLPQSQVVQALRKIWGEVNRAEEQILEKATLATLVQRSQERDTASYQI
jgi:Rrf2 family protein